MDMNNSFEQDDLSKIKEEFDFGIGLELQNNPLAETMKAFRPKQMEFEINKEMKDTVFDNIVKQSTMKNNNYNNNNNNNNNNDNNNNNSNNLKNQKQNSNLQQSFVISPEEMGEILKSLKDNNFIKDKFNDLSNSNEYLIARKLRNISNHTFETYLENCDWDYINKLTNYILNDLNIPLNKYDYNFSINPLIGLFYLIEASFGFDKNKINQMNEKYNLLNNRYIFYRKIKGDGNCFYRVILFKYLELIIFTNNIELLKDLILDVEECYNDPKILNKLNIGTTDKIKPDLVKNILTAIFQKMNQKDFLNAYKILYISFNTCRKFDMGLILYFRYILFKYINENKNKLYTKAFPVKIGNLLPGEYEIDDGKFLFNEFYENYLLKLFNDAEKIVIYLTPYVLPIKLNIILYEGKQNDLIQEFYSPDNNNCNYIISILNKKVHYELIYEINEFKAFQKFLQDYICFQYQPRFLKFNLNIINNNLDNNYENVIKDNNSFNLLENFDMEQSYQNYNSEINNRQINDNQNYNNQNYNSQINNNQNNSNQNYNNQNYNNQNYNNQNYNSQINNNQNNYDQNNYNNNYSERFYNQNKYNNSNNNEINYNNINYSERSYNQNNYKKSNEMNYNERNYKQNNNNQNNNNQISYYQNNYNESNYYQNSQNNNNQNSYYQNNYSESNYYQNSQNNNNEGNHYQNNNNNIYNQNYNNQGNYNQNNNNQNNNNFKNNQTFYTPNNNINKNKDNNENVINLNNNKNKDNNQNLEKLINNQSNKTPLSNRNNNNPNKEECTPMGNPSFRNNQVNNLENQKYYNSEVYNNSNLRNNNNNNSNNEEKVISYKSVNEFLNNKKIDENKENKYPDYSELKNSQIQKNNNKNINEIITPQNINNIQNNNRINNNYKICRICNQSKFETFDNTSSICKKCFINELIKNLEIKYFSYIDRFKDHINKNKKTVQNNFYSNVDEFYKHLGIINIFDKEYTANELSKYNIDFIEYIKYIKKQKCLNCKKALPLNNNLIKIPCNCCFCSPICLSNCFKNYIFLKDSDINICCLCSHIYMTEDLYALGLIFQKYDLKEKKEFIIKILNKMLYNQCSKCGKKSDNSLMQPIKFINSITINDNNNSYNIILANCDQLKHFLCLGCMDALNKNRRSSNNYNFFQCKICRINHENVLIRKV